MENHFFSKLPHGHAIRSIAKAAAITKLRSEPMVIAAPADNVDDLRRQCAAVAWVMSDVYSLDAVVKLPLAARAFYLSCLASRLGVRRGYKLGASTCMLLLFAHVSAGRRPTPARAARPRTAAPALLLARDPLGSAGLFLLPPRQLRWTSFLGPLCSHFSLLRGCRSTMLNQSAACGTSVQLRRGPANGCGILSSRRHQPARHHLCANHRCIRHPARLEGGCSGCGPYRLA